MVLINSECAGKRSESFLCYLLVCLGLSSKFSKSDLCLNPVSFLGLFWDTVDMPILLPTNKPFEIQHLALSLLQMQSIRVNQVMSLLG